MASGSGRRADSSLKWLVMLGVFNIADLYLTGLLLGAGAIELNPVMAWAFDQGPITAVAVKGLPMLGGWGLYVFRRIPMAARWLRILTVLLGLVVLYEMVNLWIA